MYYNVNGVINYINLNNLNLYMIKNAKLKMMKIINLKIINYGHLIFKLEPIRSYKYEIELLKNNNINNIINIVKFSTKII